MRKYINKVISICAAFVMGIMGLLFTVAPANYTAKAEEAGSHVMDDLQSDTSFDVSAYPEKSGDYSLQVIQIAESTDKELLVYVYQPSDSSKELLATSINISTAYGDSLSYKNYKLTLLSSEGVFDKYRVEGLTVLDDMLRYYDISSIYRAFDETIDKQPDLSGTENTTTEIAYGVAKRYTACTIDGAVSYTCKQTEVVTITSKVVGYIEYKEGFKLYVDRCHSHFVAFTCDYDIDTLMEADVYYVTQSYTATYGVIGGTGQPTYGEKVENYAYLKADQVTSNDADGLGAKKYEWKRIESVSTFLEKEADDANLTNAVMADLQQQEWILRFAETDYTSTSGSVVYVEGTRVTDVTILRLKFETDGVVYNLGVVDNKTTGSTRPIGVADTYFDDFIEGDWGKLPWWVWLIIAVVVILALIFIKPLIAVISYLCTDILLPFIKWLGKALWWIISAPVRFVIWIVKKIRGDYD